MSNKEDNMLDKNTNNNPFDEETPKETEATEEIETPTDKTEDKIEEETETTEDTNNLQKQLDELNNKYIRLAADFDNFRKRTQQEKEELSQYTTVKVLKQLTSVLDTFDRAQEHLKDIEECKTVKEGYEVAYKQLIEALKKVGLEEMDALGKTFDPNEHEAVTQIPTNDYEPDSVAVVMQKGYKMDKKVVRPALVGVAVKKED